MAAQKQKVFVRLWLPDNVYDSERMGDALTRMDIRRILFEAAVLVDQPTVNPLESR